MKEEFTNLELIKNEAAHRFEMYVDRYAAIIEYRQVRDTIILVHTEVPPQLEGRGAATAIIEKTLHYIEQNHFKLRPLCPLVVAYIKRHPEWNRIIEQPVEGQ